MHDDNLASSGLSKQSFVYFSQNHKSGGQPRRLRCTAWSACLPPRLPCYASCPLPCHFIPRFWHRVCAYVRARGTAAVPSTTVPLTARAKALIYRSPSNTSLECLLQNLTAYLVFLLADPRCVQIQAALSPERLLGASSHSYSHRITTSHSLSPLLCISSTIIYYCTECLLCKNSKT